MWQRRPHQIPADQGERGGVAEMHALISLEARVVAGDALGMPKVQTEAGSVSVGHAFRQI